MYAIRSYYDVATLDRLQNKKKDSRQGIVFALFSFMMKVGVGLGMFISGLLLKISGFDESLMEQSAKALKGLHLGMTLIPGIFFLIGLLFLIKYPITKNRRITSYNVCYTKLLRDWSFRPFNASGNGSGPCPGYGRNNNRETHLSVQEKQWVG